VTATPLGVHAHSEGEETTASDTCAHAEGYRTTASKLCAHAEGAETIASGLAAHAEGRDTTASGDCSHAEGSHTSASGDKAHAEGDFGTSASGSASHAEGRKTSASGVASHAEGWETTASDHCSHAEGRTTIASGAFAHAEGLNTSASGASSHAEGANTVASGVGSHAQGIGAKATRRAQVAQSGERINETGDAQSSVMTLMAYTTDATVCTMTVDGRTFVYSGPETTIYTMPPGTATMFELLIAAHNPMADEAAGWKIKGMIARPQEFDDVYLVGDLMVDNWRDTNAAIWSVVVTADTTNQCLKVAVTGEESKTIGWIARLTTAELAF
jgi:hypothetical protein